MEVIGSEFEYFQPLTTQSGYRDSYHEAINPTTALTHLGPIQFDVAGADELFIKLNNTYLELEVAITKPDGTTPTDAKCGPVNLPLHSLFSNVSLKIGNTTISDQNGFYGYRAMIETLLCYSKEVQNTQLEASLFVKDTAAKMDDPKVGGDNAGLNARAAKIKGKTIQLFGRPHLDFFHQDLPLFPRTGFQLKFIRNPDAFCLLQELDGTVANRVNYRLEIKKALLHVHFLRMSPSLILAQEQKLLKENSIFPYNHVTMKVWTIPQGTTKTQQEVFTGTVPDMVVMAMVTHDAMAGSYQLNPYHFQDFGENQAYLNVNGRIIPNNPFQPDVASGFAGREYLSLADAMNCLFGKDTVNITRDEYLGGYFLLPFMISTDRSLSTIDTKLGSVRANIGFKNATASPINVILYAVYSTYLEMDRYHNVIQHAP